ncbi:hypothetical protein V8C86DRAFT_3152482 [Haematococcus lacustris]
MPESSCPACLWAWLFAVALVYSLIQEQQVKVQDFTQTAQAAQNIARLATLALNIDIFVNKRTVPGLEGLEGPQDLAVTLDDMMAKINEFTALHSGSYLGFHGRSQLPEEFGIRWEVDGCNCTIFYDSLPLPSSKTRVMGCGTQALVVMQEQALWVWQRWPQRAQDVSVSREPWSSWGPVQFLLVNSVNSLYSAYYNTMDGLTQILIADFSKVNAQRCSLYCSFLLVPLALVRSIINRPLGLEEDSEEEEEDEAQAQAQAVLAPGGAAPGDAKQGGVDESQEARGGVAPGPLVSGMSMTRTQMWDNSGDSKERRWLGGEAGQVLRRLMFWRPPQVLPTLSGSKRTLHTSNKQLAWQLWPFLAWGVLIIILHNVAMAGLHTISGPLATLNIVNFVDMRNARTFLIAQELTWETNMTTLAKQRIAMTYYMALLRQEYNAMLCRQLSNHLVLLQGVPQLTSLHYTQATQGLAFVGGQGTDILYKPGRCLRLNQSSCLGPDSPFYHYTVNGLDTLMQQSFVAMEALANTTGAEALPSLHPLLHLPALPYLVAPPCFTCLPLQPYLPYLWDPSFKFLAATRLDREGGLDALNAAYQQHLGGTYTASLQVHGVALVLTLLLMLWLPPVHLATVSQGKPAAQPVPSTPSRFSTPLCQEVGQEMRRVAELLNQLPLDSQPEALLQRSLFAHLGQAAAATARVSGAGVQRMGVELAREPLAPPSPGSMDSSA